MGTSWALGVNHHDNLAFKQTKDHQPFLAVGAADSLAGDREIVPDCLAPFEVKAVNFEVSPAFGFVPGGHN